MSDFDDGWNAAIAKAAAAVTAAPVFPATEHGGPPMDAERIRVLDICRRHIEALRREPGG